MQYDVFNGDADGICALHQLRLAEPSPDAHLITGVKRDIVLLSQITELTSASITVLDISLDSNRPFLLNLLQAGNRILYIDHHYAGDIPENTNLFAHIDPSADQCTSLIVSSMLQGRFSKWAICGAFGDNLHGQAKILATSLNLSNAEFAQLQKIGELFNYNGYGAILEDLHYHPAHLYHAIQEFEDPLQFFIASDIISILQEKFHQDMKQAQAVKEMKTGTGTRVYFFPKSPWARRISGVFSNMKSTEKVNLAHAVIVENFDSTYQVSVRAPHTNRRNADALCRLFPTGGGRAAAAGINALPKDSLNDFLTAFNRMYP